MNETVNLHLPQFEATDRIMHDDFNDAFDKLDAAVAAVTASSAANTAALGNKTRIVTGSWSGNGSSPRTIDLGCTPKLLIVLGYFNSKAAISVAVPGLASICYSDTTSSTSSYFVLSGSTVTINSNAWFNNTDTTHRFIAFC